jgi:multisubunit Na+/H+ antiporter MnhB subunit|tara:strand:- start:5881 stop:6090 length:210 start_codon:yes stop_codon:yes gene_type:complete
MTNTNKVINNPVTIIIFSLMIGVLTTMIAIGHLAIGIGFATFAIIAIIIGTFTEIEKKINTLEQKTSSK